MTPTAFLRHFRELKIPQFIASCPSDFCVAAPKEIIDAIRKVNPQRQFSNCFDWRTISDEPKTIMSFDPEFGNPSSMLRNSFPRANVYAINFDIAVRLMCGDRTLSEWQDAPAFRYCVLCVPRSGSTLLVNLLGQIGAGRPFEHIRSPAVNLVTSGYCSFETIMAHILRIAPRNGIFGTKFVSEFMLKIFGQAGAREFAEHLNGHDYKIIYLKRNRYEQVVSWYFAARSNLWHLRGRARAEELDVPYQFEELSVLYERFQREEEFLERVLAAIPPDRTTTLDYSELDGDPEATAARAAAFVVPNLQMSGRTLQRATRKISASTRLMEEVRLRFQAEHLNRKSTSGAKLDTADVHGGEL